MSGSSGGGNVTQTQEFKPPSYTQSPTNPYWQDYVGAGAGLAQLPQPFNPGTVAPLNDLQNTALQAIADRGLNGAPDLNAARGAVMGIAQGGGYGPGMNANVQSARNQYAGPNSYLEGMIGRTADDMVSGYANGTAAQRAAQAAMAGAYGGSGYQQQATQDAAMLMKQLGSMENQYRFQDYTSQQGLAESAINRDTSNAQFNINAQQGAFQQGVGNQLNAAQLSGQFAGTDMADLRAALGAGDAYQNYTQNVLDMNKTNADAYSNLPWQALDRFGNVLSRASGSGNSQTASQPGSDPLAVLGGLLGTGYAASRFIS